jgi:putative acetyltransferase
MTSLSIRAERHEDFVRIDEIEELAFGRPGEARLVRSLRVDATPFLSLVASYGDVPVGHIFLSPIEIEGPPAAPRCAGLAPLAVHPDEQGKGVGAALVRAAIVECPRLGWQAVFLLGAPPYYSRFGFELAAPLGLHYESEVFDSAFQVLEIESGALEGFRGRVRFHRAFDEL